MSGFQTEHLAHRVLAAAEQADAADGHRDLPLADVIAANRFVAVGDRFLELGQGDAVAAQAIGIGLNLVAPDRAAEARDSTMRGTVRNSRSSTQSWRALMSLSV